jgi:hypothetical protein
MRETQVIQLVVDAHNRAVGSSYAITRHPDRENRASREIDAYAESVGLRPLAIEHTEIASLAEQSRDSAWFVAALGPLERELGGVFPFHVDIVVPYNNLAPCSNWDRVRDHLRNWLLSNCPALPDGHATIEVPGVSFRLTLWKRRCTDGESRVFLMREVPPGDRQALLLQEMHKGLGHKYERLAEYQAGGALSVLVLQSEDIALVSPQSLYEAYLRATREQPRPALDQVWMVATGSVYCFSGPAKGEPSPARPAEAFIERMFEFAADRSGRRLRLGLD